jgi:hypothetical protein
MNMADDRIENGILGDINPEPNPKTANRKDGRVHDEVGDRTASETRGELQESMSGGSQEDRSHHAGSRDVSQGTTGGTGAETGGTRNFRQGSGATGTDIGNRPE